MIARAKPYAATIFMVLAIFPSQAMWAQDTQDSANPDTVPIDQCELHVWPSNGLRSVYHGWFHGGIVDGAVKGRDGYKELPADPVSTDTQVAVLSNAALPQMLKLPDYKLIVHDEALDSVKIKNTPGSMITSRTSCYAELIADDVFYQEDIINGSYLKTLFRYKQFSQGDNPTRTFGTWTKIKLKSFPPKTVEGNDTALQEIRNAFAANIDQFANFLNPPPKKKKSK
ncbi:hypothetical protein ACFOWX_05860 [Sphingorhabdus arenilitoris]|uniref:Uncharacterized protein n=1 Tax=Sphingorhabdus arenilitoris TaxID=1490041 RepID=A0ABV8RFG7_9SPHN